MTSRNTDENFFSDGYAELQKAYLELQYNDALADTRNIKPIPSEFFEQARLQAENLSDQEKAKINAFVVKCWNDITEVLPEIIDADNNAA
ncbi:MAG: hypothetical protein KME35_23775 [Aphanocapsa sp. GSE-SYN-MK-11-07L]|jgi:hypothetical protein|nr:hypothetical protein [Aphanocapsa sp. GSE-SYN-MK-11-07L]